MVPGGVHRVFIFGLLGFPAAPLILKLMHLLFPFLIVVEFGMLGESCSNDSLSCLARKILLAPANRGGAERVQRSSWDCTHVVFGCSTPANLGMSSGSTRTMILGID
ncbi:hypothetical protein Nepgr_031278 [Nepenthes gracilis]|uniref:Uncharacterized protein n=1 Tax=Nepenthes gracilis TaxID=150966 RepID=A0AAD3TGE6_NEPGR|nr:hypothetical protein Nepgr_031278 [Nepenthes gracilis]